MARKQKLSGERRTKILARIKERVLAVNLKDLVAQLEQAETALRARADEIYFAQFPANEMEILKKYRCSCTGDRLLVTANNEDDDDPAIHDEFPMSENRIMPDDYSGRRAIIRRDDWIFGLERTRDTLKKELKEETETIMRDYSAIVHNCSYFEDVVELIPEVAKFEDELYPATGALSVLTRDVVERVRRDQERIAA